MNTFRVGFFLCCVAAIFANGCNSLDPCDAILCDPDEVCVNGDCVECESDADCDADEEVCINGNCVECQSDADCDLEEVCIDGDCFR